MCYPTIIILLVGLCWSLFSVSVSALPTFSYGPHLNLSVVSTTLFASPTSSGGTVSTGSSAIANETLTGDGGVFTDGRLRQPSIALYQPKSNRVYTNDATFTYGLLRVMDMNGGTIRTACGGLGQQVANATGQCAIGGATSSTGLIRWSNAQMTLDVTRDMIYIIDPINFSIHTVDMTTYDGVSKGPTIATLVNANTATVGGYCGSLPVATAFSSQTFDPTTFQLCRPSSVSIDEVHNIVYIADSVFGGIISINRQTQKVSSVFAGGQLATGINAADITRVFYRVASNSLMLGTADQVTSINSTNTLSPRIILWRLVDHSVVQYPTNVVISGLTGGIFSYTAGLDDASVFACSTGTGYIGLFNFSSNSLRVLAGKNPVGASFSSLVSGPSLVTLMSGSSSVMGFWYDDASNRLFMADRGFHRISTLNPLTNTSVWVGGGGPTGQGYLNGEVGVGGLAFTRGLRMRPQSGTLMFVEGRTNRIREVATNGSFVRTIIGGGGSPTSPGGHIDRPGFITDPLTGISTGKSVGPNAGNLTMTINVPAPVVDPMYPMNMFIPNMYMLIYLNASSNFVSPVQFINMPPLSIAPTGDLTGEQINEIVIAADGLNMYYTLPWNNSDKVLVRNRWLPQPTDPASRLVWNYTVLCGFNNWHGSGAIDGSCASGGPARMSDPHGLTLDDSTKRLYFADGPAIRYIYPIDSDTPSIRTMFYGYSNYRVYNGGSGSARFNNIAAVLYGRVSNVPVLFITDSSYNNVRMADISNTSAPVLYSLAGPDTAAQPWEIGASLFSDGNSDVTGSGGLVRYNGMPGGGLAWDGTDTLYVADYNNQQIRKLHLITPSTNSISSSSSSSSSSTATTSTATVSSSTLTSTGGLSSTGSSSGTSATSTSSPSSSTTDSAGSASSSDSSSSTRTETGSSSTDLSTASINQSSSSSSSSTGDAIGAASEVRSPFQAVLIGLFVAFMTTLVIV